MQACLERERNAVPLRAVLRVDVEAVVAADLIGVESKIENHFGRRRRGGRGTGWFGRGVGDTHESWPVGRRHCGGLHGLGLFVRDNDRCRGGNRVVELDIRLAECFRKADTGCHDTQVIAIALNERDTAQGYAP